MTRLLVLLVFTAVFLALASRTRLCLALTATPAARNVDTSRLSGSRRQFGSLIGGIGVAAAFNSVASSPALAKDITDFSADKAKLLTGLGRLNYLLDNWVAETTICGMSDNPYTGTKGCERTPLKVMEYMGYKSMNDPLFKADKTMRRLESLVPADKESDYLDAIEKWSEAAEEASGMAYVSSWGEANPGGGKDRVEYFIERAKKNVVDARDSLAKVIGILQLKYS
jgi:hypothetical protein